MPTAFLDNIDPVDRASSWSHELVMRESRGPGDYQNAMKRVGRKTGVGYSLLWSLRYRPPKDLPTSAFLRLWRAWETVRENQMRALEHDFARTRAEAGDEHDSIVATSHVLDSYRGQNETPLASTDHRQMAVTGGEQ
ncbi:hypothetical protein [Pseudochelatococcus contaminans]|uniref:Uncharacterized protein n=1 Tax=Pseudochelatococcus contaminans TaxID=1538103 RepID=A0A7W5Z2B0_9HYPH|nr:hypothetical protein [Pseudochelatococcus contaminans]MBB3808781.1 hypothetical protein [Pseudochelatococcus contaminans]